MILLVNGEPLGGKGLTRPTCPSSSLTFPLPDWPKLSLCNAKQFYLSESLRWERVNYFFVYFTVRTTQMAHSMLDKEWRNSFNNTSSWSVEVGPKPLHQTIKGKVGLKTHPTDGMTPGASLLGGVTPPPKIFKNRENSGKLRQNSGKLRQNSGKLRQNSVTNDNICGC